MFVIQASTNAWMCKYLFSITDIFANNGSRVPGCPVSIFNVRIFHNDEIGFRYIITHIFHSLPRKRSGRERGGEGRTVLLLDVSQSMVITPKRPLADMTAFGY